MFKLAIIGESGAGKSCLAQRFTANTYSEDPSSTIGVDFVSYRQRTRTFEVEGEVVKLQIWDTAGQERYGLLSSLFYRDIDGVIVVYDVTARESFINAAKWINETTLHAPPNASRLLVANKCDMRENREVTYTEGTELASQHGLQYLETSAKTGDNVEQAFTLIATAIKARRVQ